jgi:hypothetical protein
MRTFVEQQDGKRSSPEAVGPTTLLTAQQKRPDDAGYQPRHWRHFALLPFDESLAAPMTHGAIRSTVAREAIARTKAARGIAVQG